MGKCVACGNEYDSSFEVIQDGRRHVFDGLECAIHELAPSFGRCGCRIVGHGMEASGAVYCGAHGAEQPGVTGLQDRAKARLMRCDR